MHAVLAEFIIATISNRRSLGRWYVLLYEQNYETTRLTCCDRSENILPNEENVEKREFVREIVACDAYPDEWIDVRMCGWVDVLCM